LELVFGVGGWSWRRRRRWKAGVSRGCGVGVVVGVGVVESESGSSAQCGCCYGMEFFVPGFLVSSCVIRLVLVFMFVVFLFPCTGALYPGCIRSCSVWSVRFRFFESLLCFIYRLIKVQILLSYLCCNLRVPLVSDCFGSG
jgi:hypothetical protein